MTLNSRVLSRKPRARLPLYTDGCPNCVSAYLAPVRIDPIKGGGVQAWYQHAACGHRWYTSWGGPWA